MKATAPPVMNTHKPGERPNVLDRLNREETMLKKRLADIDAEKPTLTAFYDSLSPQQKEEFGRAAMHRMAGRMHMMMGMMGRPLRAWAVPWAMARWAARRSMGPGPMGDAPPPPPAQ